MSDPTYKTLCTIIHNGEKYEADCVITCEDPELFAKWEKKGFIAKVGSKAARAVEVRKEGTVGETHEEAHLFQFTDEQLEGLGLEELNQLILDKDPTVEPYEDELEARAHLQKDTRKG